MLDKRTVSPAWIHSQLSAPCATSCQRLQPCFGRQPQLDDRDRRKAKSQTVLSLCNSVHASPPALTTRTQQSCTVRSVWLSCTRARHSGFCSAQLPYVTGVMGSCRPSRLETRLYSGLVSSFHVYHSEGLRKRVADIQVGRTDRRFPHFAI